MTERVEMLSGKLAIHPWGEGNHDTLYCGDCIVAEWALQQIGATEHPQTDRSYGRFVRVCYWTTKVEGSPDDIKRRATKCGRAGSASVEWGASYSETMEYYGTNEELLVGGYDLLDELSDLSGNYLLLELTVDGGASR